MGVKDLWGILAPVCCHRPLADLRGECLAVDLSIWVVEVQNMKQLDSVTKPHLRHLFFRISNLTKLGVKLVFVVEGDPPPLKWATIQKRLQARGGPQAMAKKARPMTRPRFKGILRECCEMLDYLGLPYVQSSGEAEAMCALLNSQNLVDAVITNDGDAFLFGAKRVYKNFTLNNKDPHVESYAMKDVERTLCMDREKLVALGLLLGCDFVPQGVPGVGRETALKFMAELRGCSVLDRFESWRKPSSAPLSQIEGVVQRKALATPGFPFQEVIKEFLHSRDSVPRSCFIWKRPKMFHFQKFMVEKVDWENDYAFEKILPLVTLYDLTNFRNSASDRGKCLRPHSIIKKRIQKGIPCLEINWYKADGDNQQQDYYVTIEESSLFAACFPEMLQDFLANKKKTTSRKKAKPKPGSLSEETEHKIHLSSDDTPYIASSQISSSTSRNVEVPKSVTAPHLIDEDLPDISRLTLGSHTTTTGHSSTTGPSDMTHFHQGTLTEKGAFGCHSGTVHKGYNPLEDLCTNAQPLLTQCDDLSAEDSDLPDISELRLECQKGRKPKKKGKTGRQLLDEIRRKHTQIQMSQKNHLDSEDSSDSEDFSFPLSQRLSAKSEPREEDDKKKGEENTNVSHDSSSSPYQCSPAGESLNLNPTGNFHIETSLISNLSALNFSENHPRLSVNGDISGQHTSPHQNPAIETFIERDMSTNEDLQCEERAGVLNGEYDSTDDDSILFLQSQIPLAERLKRNNSQLASCDILKNRVIPAICMGESKDDSVIVLD